MSASGAFRTGITSVSDDWIIADGHPQLVSVIVPVHERRELVIEALNSVVEQTYRPIELIVIDDGSSDDTPQVVEDWIRAVGQGKLERCELVRQKNAGAAAARNTGMLCSRGEFLQFLDSDDLLTPDKIARQIELLAKSPKAAFAYCVVRQLEHPDRVIYGQSSLDARGMSFRQLQVPVTQTAAPLLRRAWVARIGPMRTDLSPFDDWEYFSRATSMGAEGVRSDSGAVLWRMSDTGPRLSQPKRKLPDWPLTLRRLRQLASMHVHAIPALVAEPRFRKTLRWQMLLALSGARRQGALRACGAEIEPVLRDSGPGASGLLNRQLSAAAEGSLGLPVALAVLGLDWLYWRWMGAFSRLRKIVLRAQLRSTRRARMKS